jgi:hypothetical protein
MSKLSKVFAFFHSPVVLTAVAVGTAAAIHTIPAPYESIAEMLATAIFAHFGITYGKKKPQEVPQEG